MEDDVFEPEERPQDFDDEKEIIQKGENQNNMYDFQKVYLGPTLPKKGIISGTVYLNGLPFNVQEAIKELPIINNLIVDISECEITRRNIKTKGTPESVFYERIAKEGAK